LPRPAAVRPSTFKRNCVGESERPRMSTGAASSARAIRAMRSASRRPGLRPSRTEQESWGLRGGQTERGPVSTDPHPDAGTIADSLSRIGS
jgi:hypothetical protein